ncbi:hypothetical protein CALCODRAFT_497261, partial [Calocera cornea HHB12733]
MRFVPFDACPNLRQLVVVDDRVKGPVHPDSEFGMNDHGLQVIVHKWPRLQTLVIDHDLNPRVPCNNPASISFDNMIALVLRNCHFIEKVTLMIKTGTIPDLPFHPNHAPYAVVKLGRPPQQSIDLERSRTTFVALVITEVLAEDFRPSACHPFTLVCDHRTNTYTWSSVDRRTLI